MPQAWSDKDERMYEHVKKSSKKRGAGKDRAKEMASRTVNKRRRQEGRTQNKSTKGTGNPHRPLTERTVNELRNRARELHITGRSTMTKDDLIEAIRKRNQ